jgi:hypothetical protein
LCGLGRNEALAGFFLLLARVLAKRGFDRTPRSDPLGMAAEREEQRDQGCRRLDGLADQNPTSLHRALRAQFDPWRAAMRIQTNPQAKTTADGHRP